MARVVGYPPHSEVASNTSDVKFTSLWPPLITLGRGPKVGAWVMELVCQGLREVGYSVLFLFESWD